MLIWSSSHDFMPVFVANIAILFPFDLIKHRKIKKTKPKRKKKCQVKKHSLVPSIKEQLAQDSSSMTVPLLPLDPTKLNSPSSTHNQGNLLCMNILVCKDSFFLFNFSRSMSISNNRPCCWWIHLLYEYRRSYTDKMVKVVSELAKVLVKSRHHLWKLCSFTKK